MDCATAHNRHVYLNCDKESIPHIIEQEICRLLSEAVEARALTALPYDSGSHNKT